MQKRFQRLIKSSEQIYNINNVLTFSKYLELKNLHSQYTDISEPFNKIVLKTLRENNELYTLEEGKCISYPKDPNIKLVPFAFTSKSVLINTLIMPSFTKLSHSLKKAYKEYIQFNLSFLNLNSCITYMLNVNEFSTKKDMTVDILAKNDSIFNSGFNIKTNKYWTLNLLNKNEIYRNNKKTKLKLSQFIRTYKNKSLVNDLENFTVDDTWVSASATRDVARDDHLVTYLRHNKIYDINDLPNPHKSKKRKRCDTWEEDKLSSIINPSQTFWSFILNKGKEFEDEIYKKLVQKFGYDIEKVGESFQARSRDHYLKTIDLMKQGKPILYQPVLQNPLNKTYGCPDLIVRSDYLNNLVLDQVLSTDEQFKPSPKLGLTYHYRVVDIKFSTLELNADAETIRNYENSKAYKMQLLVYNRALAWMQGYEPDIAYILSKGWKLKKGKNVIKSANPFKKLSKIKYYERDEQYNEKLDDGLEFINRVKTTTELNHNPPNNLLMYPNMNISSDSKFQRVKNQLAEKYKEITSVYHCSIEHRANAISNGASSYLDKNCTVDTLQITGNKMKKVVDKILKFNQEPFNTSMPIYPKKITNNMYNWKDHNKLEFFVDFETIGSTYLSSERDYIFMIGVGYLEPNDDTWKFHSLYVNELTPIEENRILTEMNNIINNLNQKYGYKGNVYHWSHAEKTQYNKAKTEFPALGNINWCDLVYLFRNEPILVHGNVSGFALKRVAKQMKKLGLIDTVWDENSKCWNGMTAMNMGYLYYKDNRNNQSDFDEIKNYNEIDCLTMKDILIYLRNNNI